jgi:hypothetical protein
MELKTAIFLLCVAQIAANPVVRERSDVRRVIEKSDGQVVGVGQLVGDLKLVSDVKLQPFNDSEVISCSFQEPVAPSVYTCNLSLENPMGKG